MTSVLISPFYYLSRTIVSHLCGYLPRRVHTKTTTSQLREARESTRRKKSRTTIQQSGNDCAPRCWHGSDSDMIAGVGCLAAITLGLWQFFRFLYNTTFCWQTGGRQVSCKLFDTSCCWCTGGSMTVMSRAMRSMVLASAWPRC